MTDSEPQGQQTPDYNPQQPQGQQTPVYNPQQTPVNSPQQPQYQQPQYAGQGHVPQAVPPAQQYQQPPQSQKTNTMAIVSLVFAFLIPIVGLILSFVAKNQIKKTGEQGAGLATAALVVSIVFWVLGMILVVYANN